MADKTNIEWSDATWNIIVGCSRVSEGCRHCYAERVAARLERCGTPQYQGLTVIGSNGEPRWNGQVRLVESLLDRPLRWRRPRKIFVNAMSDLFHEAVPDEWIDRIFAVMGLAHWHTFQILTKRADRMYKYFSDPETIGRIIAAIESLRHLISGADKAGVGPLPHGRPGDRWWPLPNVWLGVSAEDHPTAAERVWYLLRTPAAVRWVSLEPLLGEIDLQGLQCEADLIVAHEGEDVYNAIHGFSFMAHSGEPGASGPRLDWVVAGGESGPEARPMHPDWVRSLRDQCIAAGVPFFFKQWGEFVVPFDRELACKVCGMTELHDDDPDWWVAKNRCRGCVDETMPVGDRDVKFQRVGKRFAGRELDGRTWDEYPEVRR